MTEIMDWFGNEDDLPASDPIDPDQEELPGDLAQERTSNR